MTTTKTTKKMKTKRMKTKRMKTKRMKMMTKWIKMMMEKKKRKQ